MSVYCLEMQYLQMSNQDAYYNLTCVEFAVQRNRDYGSTQVAVDQTKEQTINRHTKTSGGIIGISLCPGAVQRWMLTAHERSVITKCCKGMEGIDNTESTPGMQDVAHDTR